MTLLVRLMKQMVACEHLFGQFGLKADDCTVFACPAADSVFFSNFFSLTDSVFSIVLFAITGKQ